MTLHGEAARREKLPKPTYAILRSLKGGHSGDAYLVDHEVFGQRCVQKTYSTLGLEDAAAYQEPRILHRMKHPRVPQVLEAQHDPDTPNAITFVTVYCAGRCVANALDEDYRFSTHQAIRITCQVLDALAYAHHRDDLRLIHRDPKPGNVFLDADRQDGYLGDWGSAAVMGEDATVAGIEGSPLYKPPEGGPPDGRITISGDIYGVGVTLLEMLSGPFDYRAIPPGKVDRRLTQGKRALPDAAYILAPHVPSRLARVVRKAIRRDPETRFQTAGEMIAALGDVVSIDWRHIDGGGLDGRWEGTWPPHVSVRARRRYEVRSFVIARGRDTGRRRLEARQAPSAGGRLARFGVEDATVASDDRAALERFFAAVEAKAAQRAPAR